MCTLDAQFGQMPRKTDSGASTTVTRDSVGGRRMYQPSARVSVARRLGIEHDWLFVKSNAASFLDNFQAEGEGLVRLSEPDVIGVPKPIAVGDGRGSRLAGDRVD